MVPPPLPNRVSGGKARDVSGAGPPGPRGGDAREVGSEFHHISHQLTRGPLGVSAVVVWRPRPSSTDRVSGGKARHGAKAGTGGPPNRENRAHRSHRCDGPAPPDLAPGSPDSSRVIPCRGDFVFSSIYTLAIPMECVVEHDRAKRTGPRGPGPWFGVASPGGEDSASVTGRDQGAPARWVRDAPSPVSRAVHSRAT